MGFTERLHAHFQIEYETAEEGYVESMCGFDPTVADDRALLHTALDEYLDKYLIPAYRRTVDSGNRKVDNDAHFSVFGYMDTH